MNICFLHYVLRIRLLQLNRNEQDNSREPSKFPHVNVITVGSTQKHISCAVLIHMHSAIRLFGWSFLVTGGLSLERRVTLDIDLRSCAYTHVT